MSRGRMLGGPLLLTLLGCARGVSALPPPPAQTIPPPAPVDAPAPAPRCPRVERAPRMSTGYGGWARDIPPEDMMLALDVVVPIQERLGQLFCPAERADCRPLQLVAIELPDARPSGATLQLRGVAASPARELSLALRFVDDSWQPEPESLERYLAACRAAQ